MEENLVDDEKIPEDSVKSICRCCLSTDRTVKHISMFSYLYHELSGLQVCSDGIPPWICTECIYLLEKCVKFKLKVVKAHQLLNDYLTRCAPFSIDADDPELKRYKSSQLSSTEMQVIQTGQSEVIGFHPVIEHRKNFILTPLQISLNPLPAVKLEEIKDEKDYSDYEDDMPLHTYRKNSVKPIKLENDTKIIVKSGIKKNIKNVIYLKKKKNIDKTETNKRKGRKTIEIDPEKIRSITLTLEEQLEWRRQQSVDEEYLKYPYRCELCYLGFNHGVKLDNHMKKHSPSRGKFHCALCKMYLPTIYSYKVHESSHTTRYECVKCGRRLVNRMNMIRHYSSEHEGMINQYCCNICGKKSHNYSTHTGHIRRHHKNNGIRPKCEQCGKTFITNASLIDHMLIHKGVKNFNCDICGDKFRTKSQVKFHKYKHVTAKEYYCVECDVRFKSERNLKLHLLKTVKHQDKSALLKFPCTRCPARFMSSRVLLDHISYQHDGVRRYQCDHCGREFASANTLSKHARKRLTCGQLYDKQRKTELVDNKREHSHDRPLDSVHTDKIITNNTTRNVKHKLLKQKDNVKINIQEHCNLSEDIIPKEELNT